MSQPCSALAMVLFDAAGLTIPQAHPAILLATNRGLHVGVVSNRPDVVALVEAAGHEAEFDIWLASEDGTWPFQRAIALTSVDPERILFVSDDPSGHAEARASGLQVYDGQLADLGDVLP